MRKTLAAALILLGLPASAQDASYDPAILPACLEAQKDQPDSCIGKASDKCQQGDDGGTTVGMGSCLRGEMDQWDGHLNAAYDAVLVQSEAVDAEMKELGSAPAPQAPALHEMRRAWIAFRDAACNYEASRWGGGSGAGPAATACAMELTARQAIRLRAYADEQR